MSNTTPATTLQLLQRWHRGDRSALAELVVRNLGWVQAYVRKQLNGTLRRQAESVDFVQDAMVQVLQHGPRFELADEDHFRCLLARIVTNDIQDRYRHNGRQCRDPARERSIGPDSVLYLDRPVDSVTRPSDAAEKEERSAWVRLGIEMLDAEDREILRLRQWEDASYAAIAEHLGVSVDAARMRHNRALVRLGDKVIELRENGVARFLRSVGEI